jgi:hypothetical protein
MLEEKFDFYSPSNVSLKDIDKNLKDSLTVMTRLDEVTLKHSQNVANLVTRICQYMRENNQFTIHCMIAGYIHDLGKLFIPPEIISKNGPLTEQEYAIVKSHTTLGYEYCMKDMYLRPYSDGPWYHHESLNGTGYPRGLKKSDIPYSAQVIRVADEYDALVTKRSYKTHVNISETLKDLIKDTKPAKPLVALDQLKQNERLGKLNPKPLKAMFKCVIDDILYEISCVMNYTDYLKSQIKRLEQITAYRRKRDASKRPDQKDYFQAGMTMLFQNGENEFNYITVLEEYKGALVVREQRIKDLYNEIKIIKKLKV